MGDTASQIAAESRITIVAPERMNLLGLLLRSILERRLADTRALQTARKLSGDVVIITGEMSVTLHFADGRVAITRDPPEGRVRARIRGTLPALLDAALGRGRVRAWLAGRLRVWGGPFTLLRLLSLLRAE